MRHRKWRILLEFFKSISVVFVVSVDSIFFSSGSINRYSFLEACLFVAVLFFFLILPAVVYFRSFSLHTPKLHEALSDSGRVLCTRFSVSWCLLVSFRVLEQFSRVNLRVSGECWSRPWVIFSSCIWFLERRVVVIVSATFSQLRHHFSADFFPPKEKIKRMIRTKNSDHSKFSHKTIAIWNFVSILVIVIIIIKSWLFQLNGANLHKNLCTL